MQRGKDPSRFPSVLASFASRAVRNGRRLAGKVRANDVCSHSAQQRYGFRVESLPTSTRTSLENLHASPRGQALHDLFEEVLHDNSRTPPDEQASFRIDFREWRRTRTERDRRLMDELMLGERATRVARRFGLTPGRISQLRRDFKHDWERFVAAPSEAVSNNVLARL